MSTFYISYKPLELEDVILTSHRPDPVFLFLVLEVVGTPTPTPTLIIDPTVDFLNIKYVLNKIGLLDS